MTESFIDLKTIVGLWFPLFTPEDFEADLNQGFWPIGINLDYPVELREKLTAASVAVALQYKSIDYVQKKYGGQYDYDPGGAYRRDRDIRTKSIGLLTSITDGIQVFRSNIPDEGTIGEHLSDMTFGRIPYSLSRAFAEADKGAIFESTVIARMIIEQLCWALKIRGSDDPDEISSTSATKSITQIAKCFPTLGRLYGWLSKHAHWSFDAHIKAAFDSPGMIMMASSQFKSCAYVVLGVLAL